MWRCIPQYWLRIVNIFVEFLYFDFSEAGLPTYPLDPTHLAQQEAEKRKKTHNKQIGLQRYEIQNMELVSMQL